MKTVEIICSACGVEAFLNREPIYEGFSKVGEELSCSACGHRFASEEEVPFKQRKAAPVIFTEADRSKKVQIFEAGEADTLCHYCASYVVNPFVQFCSRHKKEVQATDSCPEFERGGAKNPANSILGF